MFYEQSAHSRPLPPGRFLVLILLGGMIGPRAIVPSVKGNGFFLVRTNSDVLALLLACRDEVQKAVGWSCLTAGAQVEEG
jgi:hypothetical protein